MAPRLTPRERALRAKPEAEFQSEVMDLLHLNGWEVYHVFHHAGTFARVSSKGFPDLVAWHRTRGLFVAELKREAETLRVAQLLWLGAFERAGIPSYVWRPSDMDAIVLVAAGK